MNKIINTSKPSDPFFRTQDGIQKILEAYILQPYHKRKTYEEISSCQIHSTTSLISYFVSTVDIQATDTGNHERYSNYGCVHSIPLKGFPNTFTIRPEPHTSYKTSSGISLLVFRSSIAAILGVLYWIVSGKFRTDIPSHGVADTVSTVSNNISGGLVSTSGDFMFLVIIILGLVFLGLLVYGTWVMLSGLIPKVTFTTLEDNRFEKHFIVYPKDGIASRTFLTPERMETLTQRKQTMHHIEGFTFLFHKSKFYIYLNYINLVTGNEQTDPKNIIQYIHDDTNDIVQLLKNLSIEQYI